MRRVLACVLVVSVAAAALAPAIAQPPPPYPPVPPPQYEAVPPPPGSRYVWVPAIGIGTAIATRGSADDTKSAKLAGAIMCTGAGYGMRESGDGSGVQHIGLSKGGTRGIRQALRHLQSKRECRSPNAPGPARVFRQALDRLGPG
jgi:hypothetical protein